jgi:hypothetical protein
MDLGSNNKTTIDQDFDNSSQLFFIKIHHRFLHKNFRTIPIAQGLVSELD